jgi:hypothetical protein
MLAIDNEVVPNNLRVMVHALACRRYGLFLNEEEEIMASGMMVNGQWRIGRTNVDPQGYGRFLPGGEVFTTSLQKINHFFVTSTLSWSFFSG